jgi:hypothetical protein
MKLDEYKLPVARVRGSLPRFSLLVSHSFDGAGMYDVREEVWEREMRVAKLFLLHGVPTSFSFRSVTGKFENTGRSGERGLDGPGPRRLCRGESTGLHKVSIEVRRERMRVGDVLAD